MPRQHRASAVRVSHSAEAETDKIAILQTSPRWQQEPAVQPISELRFGTAVPRREASLAPEDTFLP